MNLCCKYLLCLNQTRIFYTISQYANLNVTGDSISIGNLELQMSSRIWAPNANIQITEQLLLAPNFYSSCMGDGGELVQAGNCTQNDNCVWRENAIKTKANTSILNEARVLVHTIFASPRQFCIFQSLGHKS